MSRDLIYRYSNMCFEEITEVNLKIYNKFAARVFQFKFLMYVWGSISESGKQKFQGNKFTFGTFKLSQVFDRL